jgi:hypothetical protein
MPNHIKNIVDFSDFSAEEFKKIQEAVLGDDEYKRLFDFLKIKPAPDHPVYHLEDEQSTKHPMNWFNWNRSRWGTKWNSYDIGDWHGKKIYFHTAWSMPDPIFKALSFKFPDAKIKVSYANEDIGRGCGVAIYQAGLLAEKFEWNDHTLIACEYARLVFAWQEDEYVFKG